LTSGRPDFSREIEKVQAQKGSTSTSAYITVPPAEERTLINIIGKGRILWMLWYTTHTLCRFSVEVDGVKMRFGLADNLELAYWQARHAEINYGLGVLITKWDPTNNYYTLMLTIPYEYKASFRVKAFNDYVGGNLIACASVQTLDLT